MSPSRSNSPSSNERTELLRDFNHGAGARAVIALCQSAPSPDDGAPPMPSDLRDALEGHFASSTTAAAPGLRGKIRAFFRQLSARQFAIGGVALAGAAACALVLMARPAATPEQTSWAIRGGEKTTPASQGTVYLWLGAADDPIRAEIAEVFPDLKNARQATEGPEQGTTVAIDPENGVTVLRDREKVSYHAAPVDGVPGSEGWDEVLLNLVQKAQADLPKP